MLHYAELEIAPLREKAALRCHHGRWCGLGRFGDSCQEVCDQGAFFHNLRGLRMLREGDTPGLGHMQGQLSENYDPPERNIPGDGPRMEWLMGPGWADYP